MGTMLEKLGGYGGGEDNLYNPEKVTLLHKQYIEAGSEKDLWLYIKDSKDFPFNRIKELKKHAFEHMKEMGIPIKLR